MEVAKRQASEVSAFGSLVVMSGQLRLFKFSCYLVGILAWDQM